MVARLGALESTVDGATGPVLEQLVDPTQAPPQAGLVSPDGTTVRIAARVPGDGDVLVAQRSCRCPRSSMNSRPTIRSTASTR